MTVICELAAQFSTQAWDAATPCAAWRAAGLAGYLRCVADDHHEYLDDAPASRLARLMATGAHPGAGDPWLVLLRASGRSPGGADRARLQ